MKILSFELVKVAALSASISACLAPSAYAADADTKTLDAVTVTANRNAVPVKETLASVTVLTRVDIEKSQAPDLADLLARQVGVDMARTGGPGSQNSLFLRGSNSNHALVLIDGIRVNSASQGLFDFAHLPLSQIDRIEIVRGPRAALWGSDAIGGVIQIFTRDPSTPYVEARAGSYGRAGINAGIGAGEGESRFGIGAGVDHMRGFSATNPASGPFVFNPDDDGYRNRNLSLRGQTSLGSQRLSFTGLLTDADVDFDQGETAAINREFGVVLDGELSSRWTHSLTLGRNSEDLDTQSPFFGSRFASTRTSLDWVNTLALDARNTLNVGVNGSRETGVSVDAFSGVQFDRSRRNAAAFAMWRGRFDAQTVELSLRRDDNSQFHGATTGNAAWGWQVSDAVRVRASWGQGFRAPNFNELYYPGFDIGGGLFLFAGNPNLQPERSISHELGLDWQIDAGQHLGLSAYRTRISGLITSAGPLSQSININHAAIDGVELDYGYQRGDFSLNGNATWQDPRNQDNGKALLRRAKRKLNVSADYRFCDKFSIGLDAQAFSARPDVDFNSFPATDIKLSGYARYDVRAVWALAADWSLEARLENVGDRDYALVQGYNTPGRSGLLTLRWTGH